MNRYVKRTLQIGVPITVAIALVAPKLLDNNPGHMPSRKNISKGSLPVTGVVATYTGAQTGITANGTLMPNEEVDLVCEIAGKVKEIYFEEGNCVKKNNLLLKVDDSDLQAQLSRALFQEKLLAEKLERQKILLQRESISRESFDQLLTDYNMLKADIQLLQVKISRTEIRAPFDGTMGFRQVSKGSYLQPSTKIARIVDNTILKYEFALPEKYAGMKLKGKTIQFHIAGNSNPFEATIYAINPSVDVNTRMIRVRASFRNYQNKLMPGMFAKGYFIPQDETRFIAIPTEAVVPEMDGKRLWVKREGKADLVKVTTESRNETVVEVLSGIHPGDTVLTGGLMQLRVGLPVNVTLK